VPGFLREYLRLHEVAVDEPALARLDTLPQTLCHNDFHPGNVLADGTVIDWAYCGVGAVGVDAGVLVVDGLADGVFPPEQADAVAAAVWGGYTRGLGFADDGVRFGFVQGVARLRWLPRATAFIQRLASES
jgi:thiamine kinase-like enzyme